MTPKEVAQLIFENCQVRRIQAPNSRKSVMIEINGSCYNPLNLKIFLTSGKMTFPGISMQELMAFAPSIFISLLDHLPEEKPAPKTIGGPSTNQALYEYTQETLICVADLSDREKYLVFDRSRQEVSEMDAERYFHIKGKRTFDPSLVVWGRISYEPYIEASEWTEPNDMGIDIPHFNAHKLPAWRKRPDLTNPTCPPIFEKFFAHFFENEASRQFSLNWLRTSIWGRNETVLCFNGAKGTGKNLFATLWKSLVGKENYHSPDKDIVESRFLGELKDRRAIFIDEARINTDEAENFIKIICNREATLPEKFKNTTGLSRLDFSIILAANREIDLRVEENDRRFSVPEITSVRLDRVFTKAERDQLWAAVEDPEMVYQFGQYLKHCCDFSERWDKASAYKEDRFRRLCQISLREWESFTLDFHLGQFQKGVMRYLFSDMAIDYDYKHKRHSLSQRAVNSFLKRPYRGVILGHMKMDKERQVWVHISQELIDNPDAVKEWMKDLYEVEDDFESKPKINLGSLL